MQGRLRSGLTEKEDMNAAATLTALMFTNRASPRQHQHQQQPPSQSRPGPSLQRGTLSAGGHLDIVRATTPVSNVKSSEDADAAELMLYLATSPSPARPTTSSMPRRTPTSMGRVLFTGEDITSTSASGSPGNNSGFMSGARGDQTVSGGDADMEIDVDGPDRDGAATPDLTFSQSSQGSTSSSLLAPPPPLRSPALPHTSPAKPSSLGPSRKLFIDGDDTRRIMGISMGITTGTYSTSTPSSTAQNTTGSGNVNGVARTNSGEFTLGKGIDLVEAK